MEKSVDRELDAILNLIQLTQTGGVQWEATRPWGDLKDEDNVRYSSVMFCHYLDKRLRLYVERIRIDEPPRNSLASLVFSASQIYPFWQEREVLEITNKEGESLWRFPYKSAIGDLMKAAKYQVAGVRDVLDSLTSRRIEN